MEQNNFTGNLEENAAIFFLNEEVKEIVLDFSKGTVRVLWFYLFYCNINIKWPKMLKVVSATFLLVSFVCLKESTLETRKNAFYFTSKALFILEIIKFKVLGIQISWRHQMPKHETWNIFYWITWEVNAVW